MAITNASTLAEYASGISTQGATLTVDANNKRVGIGTTNPQAMLQVGTGVTVFGNAGIASFTSLKLSGDTDSTSVSTGALTVTGGVGIGLSLTVGGDVSVGGTITYEDVTNVDSIGIVTARSGLRVVGGGVTCVGVATFFNDIDANGALDVAGNVSIADKIVHTGDTNTLIRFPAAGTIRFDTDGDERLRIESGGDVGINTDNPTVKLDISEDRVAFPSAAGSTILRLRNSAGSATLSIDSAANASSVIQFGDAAAASVGTIQYNHTNNHLQFNTNGDGEKMRITSAGLVGIGTEIPVGNLEVRDSKANLIVAKDGLTVKANSDIAAEYDLIQLGAGGALSSYSTATATADTQFMHNCYRHSGGSFKYRYADTAARMRVNSPGRTWIFESAASGSADANITFVEQLRIDSSGRVLIGTATSKSAGSGQYAKLNLEGGVSTTENFTSFSRAEAASAMSANDEVANLTFNDSAGYEFARIQVLCDAAPGATDTPGRIVFKTTADGASSSTNRLTIDKDGDVMMGNLAYNEGNALNVVSNTYDGIGVYRHSADASTPLLALGKSRGTSGGSTTVVQNDDYLGRIAFKGADGDEMHVGAAIDCQVDTTPGNNDMPARLVFSTVPNGSTTLTERLRIASTGAVTLNSGNGHTHATLILSKADAGAAKLEFDVGTSQKAYVELDASEDLVSYGAANVSQVFYAGGNERLRITDDGNIHSANSVQSGGNTTSGFIIGSADTAAYIGVQSKSVANGGSTSNAAFQAWLGSTNTLRINANGLIKTNAGIDFSGAQTNTGGMTSETLDAYEEGTWTPTVYGATANGTITGGTFVGHYTKIGREVRAYFALGNFQTSGASGNLTIGGLPFAADSPLGDWGANTFGWYNFDIPDNITGAPILYVSDNATYVTALYFTDNGTWGGMSISNSSGQYLKGCVAYTAD